MQTKWWSRLSRTRPNLALSSYMALFNCSMTFIKRTYMGDNKKKATTWYAHQLTSVVKENRRKVSQYTRRWDETHEQRKYESDNKQGNHDQWHPAPPPNYFFRILRYGVLDSAFGHHTLVRKAVLLLTNDYNNVSSALSFCTVWTANSFTHCSAILM